MELSCQEGEIPVPINSIYGGEHGHMIHHDHSAASSPHNHIINSASAPTQNPSNGSSIQPISLKEEHHQGSGPYTKVVRYRECLKNHAAAMGGNATDGCGEFMPNGEEGTIEALNCCACNCHRNFHRKEVEGEPNSSFDRTHHNNSSYLRRVGRKFILGHQNNLIAHEANLGYKPVNNIVPSRAVPPAVPPSHQMIMPYSIGAMPSDSDEQDGDGGCGGGGGGGSRGGGVLTRTPPQLVRKRFRTKFTQEQKEKMLNFAEKAGWKIQKQEESVVQQFCQEIGVKRRVLKVWMHNNKHNLAKKNPSSAPA